MHLMHQGRYQRRICGVLSLLGEDTGEPRNRWNLLDGAVRTVYFQSRRDDAPARKPGVGAADNPARDAGAGDVDWQLVSSYLARHRDEVNVLDVDECDSAETALARLRVLAAATVSGERVVAR